MPSPAPYPPPPLAGDRGNGPGVIAPPKTAERAFAKINLFLHIVGKRDDGYHLLDSLAVFAEAGDLLCAAEADRLDLEIKGPFASSLAEADRSNNLVLRAARALAASAGIVPRARLTLTKTLPVASGIGGGSADAAAAFRLLAPLWGTPGSGLKAIAQRLGADVPVCLESRPARMGGVGEILMPAPNVPLCGLVLLNPGIPVATADVFRGQTGRFSAPATLPDGWADAAAMATTLTQLRNDLEPAAIALCPLIGAALEALRKSPGCLLARMSGSGATCFGLFPTPAEAEASAEALAWPGWWSWGGGLYRRS